MKIWPKTGHLAYPRGFWGHFWLIWSRFPANGHKKLKFLKIALFANFLMEWIGKPLKNNCVN